MIRVDYMLRAMSLIEDVSIRVHALGRGGGKHEKERTEEGDTPFVIVENGTATLVPAMAFSHCVFKNWGPKSAPTEALRQKLISGSPLEDANSPYIPEGNDVLNPWHRTSQSSPQVSDAMFAELLKLQHEQSFVEDTFHLRKLRPHVLFQLMGRRYCQWISANWDDPDNPTAGRPSLRRQYLDRRVWESPAPLINPNSVAILHMCASSYTESEQMPTPRDVPIWFTTFPQIPNLLVKLPHHEIAQLSRSIARGEYVELQHLLGSQFNELHSANRDHAKIFVNEYGLGRAVAYRYGKREALDQTPPKMRFRLRRPSSARQALGGGHESDNVLGVDRGGTDVGPKLWTQASLTSSP